MKVYEKMLGEKTEKLKNQLIDEIMAGTIKITFPDGTVEEQVPCPLFWEHIKRYIGHDRVFDEICVEIGGCDENDIKRCWRRYLELEVNE